MPGIYDELLAGKSVSRPQLLAEFVVFSLIKRVADQAKNICEQTVFAAAGEGKPLTPISVLFLSADSMGDGKVAELVARHRYPNHGQYTSAGLIHSDQFAPGFTTLLDKLEIDASQAQGQIVPDLNQELDAYQLIVCLHGDVFDYIERVPFHTSVLHWDLYAGDEQASLQQRFDVFEQRIDALMKTVFGDDE